LTPSHEVNKGTICPSGRSGEERKDLDIKESSEAIKAVF